MNNVYIKSIGYYIPKGRLSNKDVLDNVREANKNNFNKEDLDLIIYGDSRKFEFLGIETRSCCVEGDVDGIVSMGIKAAKSALEKAGMRIEQIDCVIAAGVTNPFREPPLAIVLANQLGMNAGDFFDINDTCNGFMKSIDVATQYILSGRHKNVLLVTSENPYELADGLGIDYSLKNMSEVDNKFSTLIVGCGAAAMILSADGSGKKIVHYAEKRETANWDASLLTVPNISLPDSRPGNKSYGVWTDARLVSASIIKDVPDFVRDRLAQWNMSIENINAIIMHQLGSNVTLATLDKLEVAHEIAPVNTFRECGNMASANIPVNLAIADELGKLKKGDNILLISSACGLSYSVTHLEW